MIITQEALVNKAKKSVDMLIANTKVGLDQTLIGLRAVQAHTELHIQACIQQVVGAQAKQAAEAEEQEEVPVEVQAVPPEPKKRRNRNRQVEDAEAVEMTTADEA